MFEPPWKRVSQVSRNRYRYLTNVHMNTQQEGEFREGATVQHALQVKFVWIRRSWRQQAPSSCRWCLEAPFSCPCRYVSVEILAFRTRDSCFYCHHFDSSACDLKWDAFRSTKCHQLQSTGGWEQDSCKSVTHREKYFSSKALVDFGPAKKEKLSEIKRELSKTPLGMTRDRLADMFVGNPFFSFIVVITTRKAPSSSYTHTLSHRGKERI